MKRIISKTNAIVLAAALLGSVFIYGVVSNGSEYAPMGYNLQMDFAGEEVPTYMADVQERLDKEMITNMNYHTNTTLVIKRANKVFPVIEPILAKYGIPDDFKYLAVIESSLVNAVSPAGARGVWQFMPLTAKEKGMEVKLLYPTEVEIPRWDLDDKIKFGTGANYENRVYHYFESIKNRQQNFIDKCKSIIES